MIERKKRSIKRNKENKIGEEIPLSNLFFIFFSFFLFIAIFIMVFIGFKRKYTPCLEVSIDGEVIGSVKNEEEYKKIEEVVIKDLKSNYENFSYKKGKTTFSSIYQKTNIKEEKNIYINLNKKIIPEYTIYKIIVKDEQIFFENEEKANAFLKKLKTKNLKEKPELSKEVLNEKPILMSAQEYDSKFKNIVSRYQKPIKRRNISIKGCKPTNGLYTSFYGYRKINYGGYGHFHSGLDIAAKINTPIKAWRSGRISFCGWQKGYGNILIIDHGAGVQTKYAHLNKFYVNKGQQVKQGQTIAAMGTTGNSTGSHLHFEVLINNKTINPINCF